MQQKATAPGPLCFDQVQANHWSVEQEAVGIARYGPQWQAAQTAGTAATLAQFVIFWPERGPSLRGCYKLLPTKLTLVVNLEALCLRPAAKWNRTSELLLRRSYFGKANWPYWRGETILCQDGETWVCVRENTMLGGNATNRLGSGLPINNKQINWSDGQIFSDNLLIR